jgi:hypothetical protein
MPRINGKPPQQRGKANRTNIGSRGGGSTARLRTVGFVDRGLVVMAAAVAGGESDGCATVATATSVAEAGGAVVAGVEIEG